MRTATVVIPEGYKDAKEFAADCGFLLVDVDATKLQQTLIDIDRRGGLGQDVHNRIREALGRPQLYVV